MFFTNQTIKLMSFKKSNQKRKVKFKSFVKNSEEKKQAIWISKKCFFFFLKFAWEKLFLFYFVKIFSSSTTFTSFISGHSVLKLKKQDFQLPFTGDFDDQCLCTAFLINFSALLNFTLKLQNVSPISIAMPYTPDVFETFF